MELKVLIHGKDVVEDIFSDPGDDTHLVGIMQLPLEMQTHTRTHTHTHIIKRIILGLSTFDLPDMLHVSS